MRNPSLTHSQQQTVILGILGFVLALVAMQLWLLMATMNAFLAQDYTIVWPAAIASAAGFALNLGLLYYLLWLER